MLRITMQDALKKQHYLKYAKTIRAHSIRTRALKHRDDSLATPSDDMLNNGRNQLWPNCKG